jgi:ribosomal protein S18 acetylase RimI-like enzyme
MEDRKKCEDHLRKLWMSGYAYGFIGYLDNVAAGMLTYNWGFSTTKGLPILRIQDVFTAPEARMKGVGQALLQYIKAIAHAKGAHRLQLETDNDNKPARMLYEKMGFQWISQKEVYMLPLKDWHQSHIVITENKE